VELVFRAIESDVLAPAEPPRISLWARIRGLLRTVKPPT